jgi:hypothetical protein
MFLAADDRAGGGWFDWQLAQTEPSCVRKELFSPYMGEASGQKAFGGKWLRQRRLRFSLTITELGKGAAADEK